MSSNDVIKSVSKKLKHYFEIKRLEDGFDLSGPDVPRMDHPRLRSRPTLMYGGLHDRPLKHYFSPTDVRTVLTHFKTGDGKEGREKKVKKILEKNMMKHSFHGSTLAGSYYDYNRKNGRKLRKEMQGYGIPLRKSKRAHAGGCTVLRNTPTATMTRGEAHRLVNMASKLLVASETIDLKKDGERPQSAPKPFESDKGLPQIEDQKRPKTSQSSKYEYDIHGHRHRKQKKEDERDQDSAYSTRPGSTSPNYHGNDGQVKPWIRAEMDKSSVSADESEYIRDVEPRPPSGERPRDTRSFHSSRTSSYASLRSSSAASSHSVATDDYEDDDHKNDQVNRDEPSTHKSGEQTKGFDPVEKEIHSGQKNPYRLHVYTGDKLGASTRADIKVALCGENGRAEEVYLRNSRTHKITFQKGQEDIFDVESFNVGKIRKIWIGHNRSELDSNENIEEAESYGWYLDRVSIKDLKQHIQYDLECDKWLSSRDGDGKTFREFWVKSSQNFSPGEEDTRADEYGQTPSSHVAVVHTSPRVELAKDDGQSSRTSMKTQPAESRRPQSPDETSSTYTTTQSEDTTVTDSTFNNATQLGGKQENRTLADSTHPKPAPRRRDDFFDQQVKEQDYSSVIESLSQTTDPDNKDDFESDRTNSNRGRSPEHHPTYLGTHKFTADTDSQHSDTARLSDHGRQDPEPVRLSMTESKPQQIEKNDMHSFIEQDQKRRALDTSSVTSTNSSDSESDDETETSSVSEGEMKNSIHIAAKNGDMDKMKKIKEKYPDLIRCEDDKGRQPLHHIASAGHTDLAQWMTVNLTDLDATTPTGYTAMHLAAQNGHTKLMKVLLPMGAQMDPKTADGQTPLHLAAKSGHLETVRWLVGNGAAPQAEDQPGQTAYDLAMRSRHKEVADFLLQYNALPTDLPGNKRESTTEVDGHRGKLSPRSQSPEMKSPRPTPPNYRRGCSEHRESSSSEYSSSDDSSTYNGSVETEYNEKQKAKHDAQLMEKQKRYDEQQQKMEREDSTFLDSIRNDVDK